jgi:hypothetical protein
VSATDLSGRWDGIFSYPRTLPPTHFTLDLRDVGGSLAGESHEEGQTRRTSGQTLHALIQGDRFGSAVEFTKIYDNAHNHPVFYEGTVSDEGLEINGRWSIPGMWSGSFIMIRAKPATKAVERKVDVTV